MKNRPVIIVRHGHTKLNAGTATSVDKERGWSDVPLNDEGIQEAKDTANKLKDSGIQVIVCSDLKRGVQTAKIIGDALGVPVTPSALFRPWDLGNLTGKSTKESAPKLKYYAENPDIKVPDGESFNAFRSRAFNGLKEALDQTRGQLLCIVTHHRCERLYEAWIKNGQKPDLSIDIDVFMEKGEDPSDFEKVILNESNIGAASTKAVVKSLGKAMSGTS